MKGRQRGLISQGEEPVIFASIKGDLSHAYDNAEVYGTDNAAGPKPESE